MARYEIELDDETVLEADDARFVAGGRFIEAIPRKAEAIERYPAVVVLNAAHVRAVQHTKIGFSGGWRFDGSKDKSFARTEGSI
jgi:hypothetical protein